jgi:hypothetical protein
MAAAAVRSQVPFDMDQPFQQTVTGERDCTKEDWQFVSSGMALRLLNGESLPTNTCRAVALSWWPSARIVQVTGVEHVDVFVSLTFLQVDEKSPIRLVRAVGGLVENKDREDEAASKAVFNELLRAAAFRPLENRMLDLAILYLFMVGHPPDESFRTVEQVLSVNDVLGSVGRKGRWIDVTVHQRTSRFGHPSRAWRLKFRARHKSIELVSVAPEFN